MIETAPQVISRSEELEHLLGMIGDSPRHAIDKAIHDFYEPRLDKLEADLPLNLEKIDFSELEQGNTFAVPIHVLDYFSRVENEVALNVNQLGAFLPHADPTTKRFIHNIWSNQEAGHGKYFDTQLTLLDHEPPVIDSEHYHPAFKLAGIFSRIPEIHDILMMVYLPKGAEHEQLTSRAYAQLSLLYEKSGMQALNHTAIKPIRRQEAALFSHYFTASLIQREILRTKRPWELNILSFLLQELYRPVGVRTDEHQRAFGGVALTLAGNKLETIVQPVANVQAKLLYYETKDDMSANSKLAEPREVRIARKLLRVIGHRDAPRAPKNILQAFEESIELYQEAA
jgi:hypothetical protein